MGIARSFGQKIFATLRAKAKVNNGSRFVKTIYFLVFWKSQSTAQGQTLSAFLKGEGGRPCGEVPQPDQHYQFN